MGRKAFAMSPRISLDTARTPYFRDAGGGGTFTLASKPASTAGPAVRDWVNNSANVVDLKLHMAVRWFIGGKVDHIPATIFSSFPKLMRVHDAVRDHAGVKSWYAKA